ncbi:MULTISPECIES: hypothetical protein [unclassified Pseudomonas]|uniref:hypothetical protein n=1 Tax=unclassified Pseudomonas TaxID=196821 RepID=UPI0011BE64C7|nr:hypothetical protein [Pseudomonas sp. MWU12-2020]
MAISYRSMLFTKNECSQMQERKMIRISGVTGHNIGGDVLRVEAHSSTPLDISNIHGEKVGGNVINVISSKKQKIDTLIRDLKPFLLTLSEEHRVSMELRLDRLASAKGPKRQTRLDELQAFVLSTGSAVLANVISPYFS